MLLQANITLSKLDNGKYRQLFKVPPINWCALMGGGAKSRVNPLLKTVLAILKRYAATLLHRCPYQGEHIARNISLERSVLIIYPTGEYRIGFFLFNDADNNIMAVKLGTKSGA